MTKSSTNDSSGVRDKPLGRAVYLALTVLLATASSNAFASEYVVQIGAFSNDVREYLEPARSYGQIVERATSSGATSYSVGPFGSEVDARTALKLLQEHYPDAFVRRHWGERAETTTGPIAVEPVIARTGNLSNEQTLANLTAEERERVVYLDGILHVKEGDEFIPLAQYQHRR